MNESIEFQPPLARKHKPSSFFGRRNDPLRPRKRQIHLGIDYSALPGTEVRAAAQGIVIRVGFQVDYGNTVAIRHSKQLVTLYAHLSSASVAVGDVVTSGQPIAKSGATGRRVTAPHLHFEVLHLPDAVKMNPADGPLGINPKYYAVDPAPFVLERSYSRRPLALESLSPFVAGLLFVLSIAVFLAVTISWTVAAPLAIVAAAVESLLVASGVVWLFDAALSARDSLAEGRQTREQVEHTETQRPLAYRDPDQTLDGIASSERRRAAEGTRWAAEDEQAKRREQDAAVEDARRREDDERRKREDEAWNLRYQQADADEARRRADELQTRLEEERRRADEDRRRWDEEASRQREQAQRAEEQARREEEDRRWSDIRREEDRQRQERERTERETQDRREADERERLDRDRVDREREDRDRQANPPLVIGPPATEPTPPQRIEVIFTEDELVIGGSR